MLYVLFINKLNVEVKLQGHVAVFIHYKLLVVIRTGYNYIIVLGLTCSATIKKMSTSVHLQMIIFSSFRDANISVAT